MLTVVAQNVAVRRRLEVGVCVCVSVSVSVSRHAEGCDQNIRGTGFAAIAVVRVGLLLE